MRTRYSVALCTYNGAKYIEEQLQSILTQTVKPSQIVVSDDGSTDQTLDIVRDLLDGSNIDSIITINDGEHGVAPNFLNAMRRCTCAVIFTSDQDDVWMPNKAEEMLKVFETEQNAMLVLCDGELVDAELNSLNCTVWNAVGITPQRQQEQEWFSYLLKVPLVTGAGMAIRRSLLDDVDTIPSAWLHDGWLGWAAVIRQGFRICPQRLFLYRQHVSNVEGMAAQNVFTRLINWFTNMKEMEKMREIRFNRYDSLWQKWGQRFAPRQQQQLKQCRDFWCTLKELKLRNVFARIYIIIKMYRTGVYSHYYTGLRGMLRDIILCII